MILAYKTYKVRARFGPSTLTTGNAVYEYADKDVDFAIFLQPELVKPEGATSLIASFALVSMLALMQ